MNKTSQRGDTIVEVLIAIAVLSSVLAIAYSTMNRNLSLMRTNQERTEASRLAQSQIEQLKSIWVTSPTAITGHATSTFCIIGMVTRTGTDCTPSLYTLAIVRDTANPFLFRSRVSWIGLNGTNNEVFTVYKLEDISP